MASPLEFLKRHALVIGILLMFLLTWPIDLSNSGALPFQVPFAIYLFLGWGFIFASLIMTWLTLGRGAVVALLKRFLIWRVGWKWYAAALFLFPAIALAAILLNSIISRQPIDFQDVYARDIFGEAGNLSVFILPFFLLDFIANGEEMGWRGYVLPRLQAKHSALVSSLIVGVIWGVWHLPKFLAPGDDRSPVWFIVEITLRAILYTWLYNNTRGSLLLVAIFHASGNTAGVFLPVFHPGADTLQILLLAAVAAFIVVVAGADRLSRTQPKQMQ